MLARSAMSSTSMSCYRFSRICTSSTLVGNQRRFIRTIVPPRPAVTTLVYLDRLGYSARGVAATDISFVRTRDNKFYLQRIMENGEVVRWLAPGLERLKDVSNYDTYAINDIDENGSVIIPANVLPTTAQDLPSFRDAVHFMGKLEVADKFTRKDRREHHRQLFAHWRESPGKYLNHVIATYGMASVLLLWIVVRGFHCIKNNKPFWDMNVYGISDEEQEANNLWIRLKAFSQRHPEHEGMDVGPTMLSPGQSMLSGARAELRESDFTDPHFHSELWWKLRHLRYYGHWPKGLNA